LTEPKLTRCPGCATVFRVTAGQLALREGQVRCGHCRAVFDANDHFVTLDIAAPDEFGADDELLRGRPTVTLRSADALLPAPSAEHIVATPADKRTTTEEPPRDEPSAERSAVEAVADQEPAAEKAPSKGTSDERADGEGAPVEGAAAEGATGGGAPADGSAGEGPAGEGPAGERAATPGKGDVATLAVSPAFANEAALESGPGAQSEPAVHSEPAIEAPAADIAPIELHEENRPTRFEWKKRKAGTPPRRIYAAGIVLLSLALVVQLVVEFRDALATHVPATRVLLAGACRALSCSIAPLRETAALSIDASDLQADPAHRGLLVLSATIRNRASHPIAYPYLELTLTDSSERIVVRRAFAPRDYAGGTADFQQGIAANGEKLVKLFIDASATQQAGYQLYLFYP